MKLNLDQLIKNNKLEHLSPDDLFDELNYSGNLDICFELYLRNPTYHILSEMWMDYVNWYTTDEKDVFWSNYVEIINSNNDECKKHVFYSLWVDFFEDTGTQNEAWNRLITANLNKQAVKELLKHSGPVLFTNKLGLINKYIQDLEMHHSILMCLFGSLHDVFGDVSFPDARNVFKELKIDTSNEHYEYLKEKLFIFNSKQEYWIDRNKKDDNTQ